MIPSRIRPASLAAILATPVLLACGGASLHADPNPMRPDPLVIDDFSEDFGPLVNSSSFAAGYSLGSMMGGEADFMFVGSLQGSFEVADGAGALSVTGSGTNFQMVYDGVDGDTTNAQGLPDIDVTDGGLNDRVRVQVRSVSGSVDLLVRFWTGSTSNYFDRRINGVSEGVVDFLFDEFTLVGGADLTGITQAALFVYADSGTAIAIESIIVTGPVPEIQATPDNIRPTLRVLKKSALGSPRPRHRVRGVATDNVAVARVEARSRMQKGWRQARLQASGRWIYRTPRLNPGSNPVRFRAIDTSGNRSKVSRVRAAGR